MIWTSQTVAWTGRPRDSLRCMMTTQDVDAPSWPSGMMRRLRAMVRKVAGLNLGVATRVLAEHTVQARCVA